jgi:hypothetical protein
MKMMHDYSSESLNWEHDTMTIRQFSGLPRRGSGQDCVGAPESLYLPGRATDYGDTRLVK